MTDEDWCRFTDRELEMVLGVLGPRRQRLFAASVCQELLPRANLPEVERAIETIEAYAETGKSKAALKRSRQSLQSVRNHVLHTEHDPSNFRGAAIGLVLFAVQVAASENAVRGTLSRAAEALAHLDGIP